MLECAWFILTQRSSYGVVKPLIFLAFLSRLGAYVEVGYAEGRQAPSHSTNLTILSIKTLAKAKKRQKLLEKRAVQEALEATEQVLKRLANYRDLDIRSGQYDEFVNKCQKHINIYFPISNASTELQSDYHVRFHWRF
ncbi:hypothetical protein HHE06_03740 [Helicobacter heilmannii]|uniref:hypothetical protein n=1 Tax=Helicobacter heilmannii TaxID=35817 RepID=UPI0006A06CE4|nr:hypothetical protein [Helicobacter heilmannii]CRF50149.1 hypothetical protein HHE03_18560 [Helicobacter heilmannii]CRF50539.1 hypothetical protein HHE06_03740 [Helicobacter heilmannii]